MYWCSYSLNPIINVTFNLNISELLNSIVIIYCIVGKFGGGKVWRIWRITRGSPNLNHLNFSLISPFHNNKLHNAVVGIHQTFFRQLLLMKRFTKLYPFLHKALSSKDDKHLFVQALIISNWNSLMKRETILCIRCLLDLMLDSLLWVAQIVNFVT